MAKSKENKEQATAKEPSQSKQQSHGQLMPAESEMSRVQQGPLSQFRQEFDRLFDNFFSPNWLGNWPGFHNGNWGFNIQDEDEKVVVQAEAPGFEPEDFDIQVRDQMLTLCACHRSESKEENGGHHWQQQELRRSITLPSGIDAEHVEAQYRNGVLTVTLPKTEKSQNTRIPVKPGA